MDLIILQTALRCWRKDLVSCDRETNKPCSSTAGTPLQLVRSHLYPFETADKTCMHMIEWLCLYKHAMHPHLRCVERHIKRGWFPPTDPPLCGMPWHYKQASWRRRASVIVARGGGDKQSVRRAFNWLIASLCLPVIIKMTQPPPVPVTVVASQRQQQSCYCLSFSWKDRVGQRAEGFCSESWKIWCPAWAVFSNAPWEMSYLSSACKKPWH